MVLGIERFKRLPRFDKSYKRLKKQDQAAVTRALRDLLSNDELPLSRYLEKVNSRKNTFAIRITIKIRLSFEVKGGICILRKVGDHDKVLDNP